MTTTNSIENNVISLLKYDGKIRDKNSFDEMTKDLFTYDKIEQYLEWDYSLPTIVSDKRINNDEIVKIGNLTDFEENFNSKMPLRLKNMNNILFAGGSICSVLRIMQVHDIDIFLYGLSEDDATKRVDELIDDIVKSYDYYLYEKQLDEENKNKSCSNLNKYRNKSKKYEILPNDPDIKYIRNKNCITLVIGRYIFQIILRIYRNVSEILHGFDIGSAAVGYDGTQLWFTSLSKFAYEYNCNIVDPSRRSTTYEKRLDKYFKRGFDIILPYMDISKIRNVNSKYGYQDLCILPNIVFAYNNITGNKIMITKIIDYDGMNSTTNDYQIEDLNEYNTFYITLHSIIWNKSDYYFYAEKLSAIHNKHPNISRRKVINLYDGLAVKAKQNGSLNFKLLKRYIGDTKELAKILSDGTDENTIDITLSNIIEKEKNRVLQLVDDLSKHEFCIKLITDNPGTQITSSINPIMTNAKEWYGEYYKDC